MFRLKCKVQKYQWGKLGAQSEVSRYVQDTVDPEAHYAELWMGVHPNGPSALEDGTSLADYLKSNPKTLGDHEKGELQFLFKVLSVDTALSVQSHPTNEQAQILHKKDPKNYPDPRHKPEISIALDDFELLCGFRQNDDLLAHIKNYNEVIQLFDEGLLSDFTHEDKSKQKEILRQIFTTIWKSPKEKIAQVVGEIIERIKKHHQKTELDQLLIRLDGQYPGGDVGVLAPIFLNYFTLKAGESTFLGPNEPHAYLSGNCIECMACSDNTIRAGLTPKFKDVETLTQSLTYNMTSAPYFHAKEVADGVLEYAPPVPEFAVQKLTKAAKKLPNTNSSSIIVVVNGEITLKSGDTTITLKAGQVGFVSAGLQDVTVSSSDTVEAFRAFTPIPN
ncbi:unnamed protein product [Bursaphelenchus okinawaensis]|uniref:mannose-6-phosphate isomerase n=1 Tax=Bursaphelenchus okinawaensis TaxID=465554 RepID=A0A811LN67_9BILA|nr:unnamed protein product [Bursaphelenchus okinawaensis]CAG9125801.1 unnamed protein product [Bursaphelenchus okinawaensis]